MRRVAVFLRRMDSSSEYSGAGRERQGRRQGQRSIRARPRRRPTKAARPRRKSPWRPCRSSAKNWCDSAFGKVDPEQIRRPARPGDPRKRHRQGAAARACRPITSAPDGKHVDSTPASDVTFIGGSGKPPRIPGTSPLPFPRREKKGPLNIWEIEGRAFSAKLIAAGRKGLRLLLFPDGL